MPRGLGDIASLRLEVLQDFVTTWMSPPELMLHTLFPSSNSPSSTILWESKEGGRGMSPFKPPGAPTQITSPFGIAEHSAEAAFWGDKMFFDEEFLNNLRKPGQPDVYMPAQQRLAEELGDLTNRAYRRKEWMFSKMLFSGSFTYQVKQGVYHYVDYGIRDDHIVTLGSDYKWENGTKRDIWGDITTAKRKVKTACGGTIDWAACNSTVLEYLAKDPTMLTLLQKSTFGDGDLFKGTINKLVGVNPRVIASLLDIPNLLIYDEQYEVRSYLTAVVTADSTVTIYVEDASDYEIGGTLRFVDVSAGTYEEETISAVSEQSGTVTVSTAPSTSYKATADYVTMIKYFIPDDKFVMFASRVDGKPIAEYKAAPFGLDRNYGLKPDRWEDKDPDGVYIRVEDKGLPILKQRDGIYILDVN
uniref:Putative capsid protein n=1 Tax=viral metagenome TaxID=1070528 RepID=A0A6M3ISS3_9ZZZZ